MSRLGAVLLAAGQSTRFKDREKKPYADLLGRAVWLRSLELFAARDDVAQILLVISPEDEELVERRYRSSLAFVANASVVHGGAERTDSVRNALAKLSDSVELVAIHDTARACLTGALLDQLVAAADKYGAAIPAAPLSDTIKRAIDHDVVETLSRKDIWQVQTPQVFQRSLLIDAYAKLPENEKLTDDSQVVERLGQRVRIVPSDHSNLKITTKQDLLLAGAIIKSREEARPKTFHPFGDEKMWT